MVPLMSVINELSFLIGTMLLLYLFPLTVPNSTILHLFPSLQSKKSRFATPAVEARNPRADTMLTGAPMIGEEAAAASVLVEMGGPPPPPEILAAGTSSGKRKRGRPAKGHPKAPQKKTIKHEEDVCFICLDGGDLVLCDRRGCPKAYHLACIKRGDSLLRSKAQWNCGWHICSSCEKAAAHYKCYTCTYSWCKACFSASEFMCVRGSKGFCIKCMRIVMLIENNVQGDEETVRVDFDDKSTWEYLFKAYWIYLKGKLSLTLDELTKAKHPWKGVGALSCNKDSLGELYDINHEKGSTSNGSSRSKCMDSEILRLSHLRDPASVNEGVASPVYTNSCADEAISHVLNEDGCDGDEWFRQLFL